MTPEKEFEKWWTQEPINDFEPHITADHVKKAYLAATTRTAQECVEMCRKFGIMSYEIAQNITERFLK